MLSHKDQSMNMFEKGIIMGSTNPALNGTRIRFLYEMNGGDTSVVIPDNVRNNVILEGRTVSDMETIVKGMCQDHETVLFDAIQVDTSNIRILSQMRNELYSTKSQIEELQVKALKLESLLTDIEEEDPA